MDAQNTDDRPVRIRLREYVNRHPTMDPELSALLREAADELERYHTKDPSRLFAEQTVSFAQRTPGTCSRIVKELGTCPSEEALDYLWTLMAERLTQHMADSKGTINNIISKTISDTAEIYPLEKEAGEER
jgi:hypothetical protein